MVVSLAIRQTVLGLVYLLKTLCSSELLIPIVGTLYGTEKSYSPSVIAWKVLHLLLLVCPDL
jgi:hypothetical protein